MIKKSKEWYIKYIEAPVRGLVKLLRDNGFDTNCSCGHLPNPYISMKWDEDTQITKLHDLLIKNGYRHFVISGRWDIVDKWTNKKKNDRSITIRFYPKQELIKEKRIRGVV